MNRFAIALAGIALATISPAYAQPVSPYSRLVPLTFTGVVSNDATQTIRVRQANGTLVPYTGPVPDYPYKPGDQVSISFNAVLPNQAYYQPGSPYTGQVAADGIYRISLGGQQGAPGSNPGVAGLGAISLPDVTGPIRSNANGNGSFANMLIVYDSRADTYSLEFPNGRWGISDINGPSFTHDQGSGALASAAASCRGGSVSACNDNNPGGFGITGDANSAGSRVNIWTPSVNGDPNTSFIAGFFDLLFSGSWNLPTFGGSSTGGGSSGGAQVPEPSMMLLFGGASAILLRRRRKKVA